MMAAKGKFIVASKDQVVQILGIILVN